MLVKPTSHPACDDLSRRAHASSSAATLAAGWAHLFLRKSLFTRCGLREIPGHPLLLMSYAVGGEATDRPAAVLINGGGLDEGSDWRRIVGPSAVSR